MSENRDRAPSREPLSGRPHFTAGYGVGRDPTPEQLQWTAVRELLIGARNYWIGSTWPDGRPHAAPVWGLWLDEALFFSTDAASVKGRNLGARPEVVAHLESGDDVVILEGVVEKIDDMALRTRFADAYNVKYSLRPDPGEGLVYRLRPRIALAWLERSFQQSATRFEF